MIFFSFPPFRYRDALEQLGLRLVRLIERPECLGRELSCFFRLPMIFLRLLHYSSEVPKKKKKKNTEEGCAACVCRRENASEREGGKLDCPFDISFDCPTDGGKKI